MSTPAEIEAKAQFEAPERLQPGQAGWWEVWGARLWHVVPGDIIVMVDDGELTFDEVGSIESVNLGVRYRITATDGTTWTLGAGFAGWKLFRRGTHNTLAE